MVNPNHFPEKPIDEKQLYSDLSELAGFISQVSQSSVFILATNGVVVVHSKRGDIPESELYELSKFYKQQFEANNKRSKPSPDQNT
jgi:hypothetical protein